MIKKYIFIIILIFIYSISSIAQTDTVGKNQTEFLNKGKRFINFSGTSGMLRIGNTTPQVWYILNPRFGYFFINKFALGVEVQQGDYDAVGRNIFFSTGLFGRYYVPIRKISILAEAGYSAGTYAFNDGPAPLSIYRSGIINAGIGGQVLLGKKLGLELLLDYERYINAALIRRYNEGRFTTKLGINYYF